MFRRVNPSPYQAFGQRALLPRANEAQVLELLDLLFATLSGASRAALAADLLQRNLARMTERIAAILRSVERLRLEEVHGHLKVNAAMLSLEAQNLDLIRGLAFLLVARNVRAITFEAGLLTGELGELVRLLALPETDPEGAMLIDESLRRAGALHVAVETQVRPNGSAFDDIYETFSAGEAAAPAIIEEGGVESADDPEAEAIRAIARLVEEDAAPGMEGRPAFDPSFDFRVEASADEIAGDGDGLLSGVDEEPPIEPAITFTRLDEPLRAGEPGDTADMVGLADLDDESEQLLDDHDFEEGDFRGELGSAAVQFNEPKNGSKTTLVADVDDDTLLASLGDGLDVPVEFRPAADADGPDKGRAETDPSYGDAVSSGAGGVMFLVRVGRFPLEGATIKVRDVEVVAKKTRGPEGARFDLPPGEYDVEIAYEDYQVRRRVAVGSGRDRIEIDLQSVFNY